MRPVIILAWPRFAELDQLVPVGNGLLCNGERVLFAGHHDHNRSDARPDDPATLTILDYSEPDVPTLLSYFQPHRTGKLIASGEYLYLLSNGQAHVIDVSVPATPRFIGEIGDCGSLAVDGEYLYTSGGTFCVRFAPCADMPVGVGDLPTKDSFGVRALPNPFNPTVTVEYSLPSSSDISISIHDVQGRNVFSLLDHERRSAGTHTEHWDGRTNQGVQAASGVYFLRIEQNGHIATQKITLLK